MGGRYYLKGVGSGRCLDIPSSNPNAGIQDQIWECNDSGAQRWTISYTSDDYYKITNYYGKSLEVRDGSMAHQMRFRPLIIRLRIISSLNLRRKTMAVM
ncbi:MAG: RICIN domain-containing protein [Oligoflexus sp.]|nr:RICIN domain-containing protein [Oligoflexus sp.]